MACGLALGRAPQILSSSRARTTSGHEARAEMVVVLAPSSRQDRRPPYPTLARLHDSPNPGLPPRSLRRGTTRFDKVSTKYSGSDSDRPSGHSQNVESRVKLLLAESAVGNVAVLDDHLTNGLTLLEGLLGYRGGVLIADVAVQRRDDGR